jgi:hypothetical protein
LKCGEGNLRFPLVLLRAQPIKVRLAPLLGSDFLGGEMEFKSSNGVVGEVEGDKGW